MVRLGGQIGAPGQQGGAFLDGCKPSQPLDEGKAMRQGRNAQVGVCAILKSSRPLPPPVHSFEFYQSRHKLVSEWLDPLTVLLHEAFESFTLPSCFILPHELPAKEAPESDHTYCWF